MKADEILKVKKTSSGGTYDQICINFRFSTLSMKNQNQKPFVRKQPMINFYKF